MSDHPTRGLPPEVAVSPFIEVSENESVPREDEAIPMEIDEDVVMYSDGDDGDDGDDSGSPDDGDSSEGNFVLEHVYENGRRYANLTYPLPSDETEETRLAIVHQLHMLLLKGHLTMAHVSPRVRRILDIGTGPGDWAIAMGEAYPRAQVVATDITVFRNINVPPNVTFQIEDSSQEWTWTEPFDLIHMRDIQGAFPDYLHVYKQAARALVVGGTLEVVNSGPFRLRRNYEASYTKVWTEACQVAMETAGFEWWKAHMDKALVEQSGLRIQRDVRMEVALGDTSNTAEDRRIGRMALVATCEAVEACGLRALTKYLGWTPEQTMELNEKVREELCDPENEPYLDVQYILAKKLLGIEV